MVRSEIAKVTSEALCPTDTFFLCPEQSARHFEGFPGSVRTEMLEGARHHAFDTIYTAIFFTSTFHRGVVKHG